MILQNAISSSSSANSYQTCTTLSRLPAPCIRVKVFSILQNSSLFVSVPVTCLYFYCRKLLLADTKFLHPSQNMQHTYKSTHMCCNMYTTSVRPLISTLKIEKEGLFDRRTYKCPYRTEKVKIYFFTMFFLL